MTIKTSTGSSKTELSSRGKRPFKVFGFSHFFSPQTVGGLASAGSVWPGDAHDGNGGPACASTEPFAAFDARAQCHKARSFSFSNK